MEPLIGKDFFGQTVQIGDIVAALGVRYQEFYLFRVGGITPKKFKLEPIKKTKPWSEPDQTCYKFHHQCILKPRDEK